MNMVKLCSEYCIGCGLCQSERNIEMKENEKGYLYPVLTQADEEFLKNVCPITDDHAQALFEKSIWGKLEMIVAAYSVEESIRKQASSGGVLTALSLYLLENKLVDGIVQVRADEKDPTRCVCQVSKKREEVLNCCGSRYAISSPWKELSSMIEEDKKYAVIGKPCDIRAIRRLKNTEKKYRGIQYLMSFFCAGLPSGEAQKNLLNQMGVAPGNLKKLTYRGNGWPGFTTAVDEKEKEYTMEYSRAWGKILGRDVHPYCRLCIDGTGEEADISCGDGWYIKNGQPDFTERDGRNIVFARNSVGSELLKAAMTAGYLVYEDWGDMDALKVIQNHQYTRKTTIKAKSMGYRLCGRKVPVYDKKLMKKYDKSATFKQKAKMFLGTVKRIIQGRI